MMAVLTAFCCAGPAANKRTPNSNEARIVFLMLCLHYIWMQQLLRPDGSRTTGHACHWKLQRAPVTAAFCVFPGPGCPPCQVAAQNFKLHESAALSFGIFAWPITSWRL